jgi:hypothetical protein
MIWKWALGTPGLSPLQWSLFYQSNGSKLQVGYGWQWCCTLRKQDVKHVLRFHGVRECGRLQAIMGSPEVNDCDLQWAQCTGGLFFSKHRVDGGSPDCEFFKQFYGWNGLCRLLRILQGSDNNDSNLDVEKSESRIGIKTGKKCIQDKCAVNNLRGKALKGTVNSEQMSQWQPDSKSDLLWENNRGKHEKLERIFRI